MKHFKSINAVGLVLIVGLMAFRVATSDVEPTRRELTGQQMGKIYGGECSDAQQNQLDDLELRCNAFNQQDACLAAFNLRIICNGGNPGGPGNEPPCIPCPNGGTEEEYALCQQIGGQILGPSACGNNPQRICCN